jgi:hypothetical protein
MPPLWQYLLARGKALETVAAPKGRGSCPCRSYLQRALFSARHGDRDADHDPRRWGQLRGWTKACRRRGSTSRLCTEKADVSIPAPKGPGSRISGLFPA